MVRNWSEMRGWRDKYAIHKGEISPLPPLDRLDPPDLPDRLHEGSEVVGVVDRHFEIADRPLVARRHHRSPPDVHLARGDAPGDVGQKPRLVGAHHAELDGVYRFRPRLPAYLDRARRVALEDFRALLRVDRDPPPPGDEPDDRIARHRVAAVSQPDEDAVHPLHDHGTGPARHHLPDEGGQPRLLALLLQLFRGKEPAKERHE